MIVEYADESDYVVLTILGLIVKGVVDVYYDDSHSAWPHENGSLRLWAPHRQRDGVTFRPRGRAPKVIGVGALLEAISTGRWPSGEIE